MNPYFLIYFLLVSITCSCNGLVKGSAPKDDGVKPSQPIQPVSAHPSHASEKNKTKTIPQTLSDSKDTIKSSQQKQPVEANPSILVNKANSAEESKTKFISETITKDILSGKEGLTQKERFASYSKVTSQLPGPTDPNLQNKIYDIKKAIDNNTTRSKIPSSEFEAYVIEQGNPRVVFAFLIANWKDRTQPMSFNLTSARVERLLKSDELHDMQKSWLKKFAVPISLLSSY